LRGGLAVPGLRYFASTAILANPISVAMKIWDDYLVILKISISTQAGAGQE